MQASVASEASFARCLHLPADDSAISDHGDTLNGRFWKICTTNVTWVRRNECRWSRSLYRTMHWNHHLGTVAGDPKLTPAAIHVLSLTLYATAHFDCGVGS